MINSISNFYEDAYYSDLQLTWLNTKFNLSIADMAYYKALSVWFRDGRIAEEERRELIYSYLNKSGFASSKENDLIRSWFATLPVDNNFIKRISKNVCDLYTDPPQREIEDNEDLIKDAINESNFNLVMKRSHEVGKMVSRVMLHPRIRNGKPQIQLLYPDQFQTVKDENGVVVEVWIPYYEYSPDSLKSTYNKNLRFEVWDKESLKIKDENGKDLEFIWEVWKFDENIGEFVAKYEKGTERKHNYGRLPFAFLTFDINDDDGTQGSKDYWEFVKTQIELNLLDLLTRENVIKSFAIWIMINFGLKNDNIDLGHGHVIKIEGIDGEGQVEPRVDTASLPELFDAIEQLKTDKEKAALKRASLPTSLVTDNPGLAASGEAMKIDRLELEEIRKEDIYLMKSFDEELLNLLLTVLNVDGDNKYKGKFNKWVEIGITYNQTNYLTKEEENAFIELRKQNGTIGILEYYQYFTNDKTVQTKEDAIKRINENKSEFQLIGDSNGNESGLNEQFNAKDESIEITNTDRGLNEKDDDIRENSNQKREKNE